MVEDVMVPRDKLDELAEALGARIGDWSDPEAALDELIAAASGNGNGNGDDFEDVDAAEPGQGLTEEVTRMSLWGAPRRFYSKAAEERYVTRTVAAFESMLPGRRNRSRR
jgi:hypothetical protein